MRDDAGSKVPRGAGSAPARGNGTTKRIRSNLQSSSLNDACPHLGIDGDPATNFAFAAAGNRCFQASSPQAIPLRHQQTFCLQAKHSACPIFRNAAGAGPPPHSQPSSPWHHVLATRTELLARLLQKFRTRLIGGVRSLAVAVAALSLLALIAALFFNRQLLSTIGAEPIAGDSETVPALAPSATATQPSTAIEKTVAVPSASATLPSPIVVTRPRPTVDARLSPNLVTTTSPSPTAGSTAAPTATLAVTALSTTAILPAATSTFANCDPPAGWGAYIVPWGETLFRIGLRFDVSVDVLRQANCLTSTAIYAGQSIFVPYQQPAGTTTVVPTSPVSVTPTPSP